MAIIGRYVMRRIGYSSSGMEHSFISPIEIRSRSTERERVDCKYSINLLYHLLDFTGLAEANTLHSEMKVQLLPYETEPQIRHQSFSPFFCPFSLYSDWLPDFCVLSKLAKSCFFFVFCFLLYLVREIWEHKTQQMGWFEVRNLRQNCVFFQ